MVAPVLVGLFAAAALGKLIGAGASIYETYKSTENSDKVNKYVQNYSSGYREENERFWNQYIARHHLQNREILYPYRTGYNYNLANLYASESALGNNELSRNMSWFNLVRAGTSVGPTLYRGIGGY